MLAVILLTTPPSTEANYEAFATPQIMATLRDTAVSRELMDRREIPYVMIRSTDFSHDLFLLQTRYQALQDAPPASDADRFPDRSVINDMLTLNRSYCNFLTTTSQLDQCNEAWYVAAIAETNELYQVWDAARDGRLGYVYVHVTRQSLKKLRNTIGHEAYNAGCLPPCVPLHRFRTID